MLAPENLNAAKVFSIGKEKRKTGIKVSKVFGQDSDAVVAHTGCGNFKIAAGFYHCHLALAVHRNGFPDLVFKNHLVATYDIDFQRFAVFIHHFTNHLASGFELEGKCHLLTGFVDGEVFIGVGISPATGLQGDVGTVVPTACNAAGMLPAIHDFEISGIVARYLLKIAHCRGFDAHITTFYRLTAAFVEQTAVDARGQ